jgi:transposase-like protein
MRGKKVAVEIKTRVIEESLKPRCVITKLAEKYGISPETVYGWRSSYNRMALASTVSFDKKNGSDSVGQLCRFLKTAQNCLPKMLSCNEWPGMSGL